MRTSLIETQQLEAWLLKKGDPAEWLVTEAKVQVNADLKEKAHWQSTMYDLLHLYGREKLKEQIKAVEHQVFTQPRHRSFQQRILSIFKR